MAACRAVWMKSMEIAKSKSIKIIEDAAHSFPATYKSKKIGTIGDVTLL